jgi:hypothetical protein
MKKRDKKKETAYLAKMVNTVLKELPFPFNVLLVTTVQETQCSRLPARVDSIATMTPNI